MKSYSEHNLIQLAVKTLGSSGVRIANHIDYADSEDQVIYNFAIQEVQKFVTKHAPDEDKYGHKLYLTLAGAVVCGEFIEFPSAELAQEFFNIFNVRGNTYASGLYAELYIDGELVSENT
jgi:hypothetical protein